MSEPAAPAGPVGPVGPVATVDMVGTVGPAAPVGAIGTTSADASVGEVAPHRSVGPDEADPAGTERPLRRPALSPSRAGDFRMCPLRYRFRAIDRLPEVPGPAQVRGTLVHAVIERLFALPAAERSPQQARALVPVVWAELAEAAPGLAEVLFGPAEPDPGRGTGPAPAPDEGPDPDPGLTLDEWLASAGELLDVWFTMEDPRTFEPAACELLVETELASGTLLRGYIDRLDAGPDGVLTVVDYKTGAAPAEYGEAAAMFQLKFYALALLQLRGVVPAELRLLYLRGGQWLFYSPDEAELRRFERVLDALWEAIVRAGRDGDFPPRPGPACRQCSHRALCPAWDGTPPPYPGWPQVADDPEPTELGAEV